MTFSIDLSEIERAAADWQKVADEIGKGMRPAVDSALLTARGAARNAAPKVTHRLENSIDRRITRSDDKSATGIVEATAPHAKFVLEDTKPHEIVPRRASVLAFESGGTTVFTRRVHHPGTKAQDFITPTGDVAEPKLEAEANRIIDEAIARFEG